MKREITVRRVHTLWEECLIEIEVDEQGNPLQSDQEIFDQADEEGEWESYSESTDNEDWYYNG